MWSLKLYDIQVFKYPKPINNFLIVTLVVHQISKLLKGWFYFIFSYTIRSVTWFMEEHNRDQKSFVCIQKIKFCWMIFFLMSHLLYFTYTVSFLSVFYLGSNKTVSNKRFTQGERCGINHRRLNIEDRRKNRTTLALSNKPHI